MSPKEVAEEYIELLCKPKVPFHVLMFILPTLANSYFQRTDADENITQQPPVKN